MCTHSPAQYDAHVHVHVYVHTGVYVPVHTGVYVHVHTGVYVHVHTGVYVYVCTDLCVQNQVYMDPHLHAHPLVASTYVTELGLNVRYAIVYSRSPEPRK